MPPLGKRINDNGGISINESPAVKLNRTDEQASTTAKLAPFIHKLEHLLRNNRNVFWSEDGKYLVIDGIRSVEFSQELADVQLSNKHESFIRQMNTYGFRKEEYTPTATLGREIKYPTQLFAYFNPNFTEDHRNYEAVHNKGKRKPIQQERETVSQLKLQVQAQQEDLNQLAVKLANEQQINRRQQEFMTQIAASIGTVANGAGFANIIYKFLATETKTQNTPFSSSKLEMVDNTTPMDSLINSTCISRSLTPNSQILQANSVVTQTLEQQPTYIATSFQPLNVTIPPPIQVQPTNETQTIQVGGNSTPSVLSFDELLKNPVYAAFYIKNLMTINNQTNNQ